MFAETFPRLAVRLRSIFPDATVELAERHSALCVTFPNFPNWQVDVGIRAGVSGFCTIESSIVLRFDCLQDISDEDYLHLFAAENLGLRGATVLPVLEGSRRTVKIRSAFTGQKGRTVDEAENLAIDVLSILRFARLLDDRVARSTVGDHFCFELYYTQYHSGSVGRNRFINYARGIFHGSVERVFGQVSSMIREDYHYRVEASRDFTATVVPPYSPLSITMRIPDEIPVLACTTPLEVCPLDPVRAFALAAKLNSKLELGHIEVSADGSTMSFVVWKHLTNDLRQYGFDTLLQAVHAAYGLLQSEVGPTVAPEARVIEISEPKAYKLAV